MTHKTIPAPPPSSPRPRRTAGGSALKISEPMGSRIRDLAAEHGRSAAAMAALLLAYGIGRLRSGPDSRPSGGLTVEHPDHPSLMKTALVITPVRFLTEEEKARLRARCRLEGISPRSFVSHVVRRALAAGSEAGAAAPEPR